MYRKEREGDGVKEAKKGVKEEVKQKDIKEDNAHTKENIDRAYRFPVYCISC